MGCLNSFKRLTWGPSTKLPSDKDTAITSQKTMDDLQLTLEGSGNSCSLTHRLFFPTENKGERIGKPMSGDNISHLQREIYPCKLLLPLNSPIFFISFFGGKSFVHCTAAKAACKVKSDIG